MTRAVLIAIAAAIVGFAPQTAPSITADGLRSLLTAFAHDSMLGRYTGSAGAERATSFIVTELDRRGLKPTLQTVPIVTRQLDLEHTKGVDMGFYVPGVDFLPLVGAFGIASPESVTVKGSYVAAGELGASNSARPAEVAGKFAVFLPPTRQNGIPDYQLWDQRETLLAYRGSTALFVATLDLMPRSFIDELTGPRMVLKERVASLPASVPIIAFTRGVAQKAIGSVNSPLTYRTKERQLEHPARNIVAVVEGSDATLKSEIVVLSAPMDHLGHDSKRADSIFNGANAGSGTVALLAIANDVVHRAVKPKRTTLFLWTTGSTQGYLGAEFFADHPTADRASIVANISVDRVARGPLHSVGSDWLSSAFSALVSQTIPNADAPSSGSQRGLPRVCGGSEWHFTRWGIPSVRISGAPDATDNTRTDDAASIDFDGYARAVADVAALVERVANADARPALDVAKPDQRAACVR